jgi:hypothetical protein
MKSNDPRHKNVVFYTYSIHILEDLTFPLNWYSTKYVNYDILFFD